MRQNALPILAILATSCATIGNGEFCRVAEPIMVDDESLRCMSVPVAEQIRDHNRVGRSLCGW